MRTDLLALYVEYLGSPERYNSFIDYCAWYDRDDHAVYFIDKGKLFIPDYHYDWMRGGLCGPI